MALGELGGGYSAGGSGGSQTSVDTVTLTRGSQLSASQDLELGLDGGALTGTGVTSVLLNVMTNNQTVKNHTYTGAAALAYFQNSVLDLGDATAGEVIKVTLTVTTASAGSAFDANLLIGAQAANLTAAMASIGTAATTAASTGPSSSSISSTAAYQTALAPPA